jgi:ribosomal protein S18 acetylase RimI-like enzyme
MITYATVDDLMEIDELAVSVIENMGQSNIPQWTLKYPRYEHFEQDVIRQALIVYKDNDSIAGAMAILEENDPPYKTISSWQKEYSIVIHRLIVDPNKANSGIAQKMLDFAIAYGLQHGYESIKIDTHLDNYKMRRFLKKNGFIEGDYIAVMDRIAYEKILEGQL